MQRFYQGQLDFFCAVYAVINTMTALYGISLAQARSLFASVLGDISNHPGLWRITLYNNTDFHWLTSYMLLACSKAVSYPVRVFRPFTDSPEIPESAANLATAAAYAEAGTGKDLSRLDVETDIWRTLADWLPESEIQPRAGNARRVAICRFHRYMRYVDDPIVSHWSVMDHHQNGIFHLRDASKEPNALYSLDRSVTVFAPERISETHNVRIEPHSIFFVERR